MKHDLRISVSKRPKYGGIVSCRCVSVRERILKFLLGNPARLTIVVPGDSVETLSINEVGGEKADEQDKTPA